MKRVILISGVVLLIVFWTAGCGTLETLLQKNNSQESLGSLIGGEAANVPTLVNPAEGKTVSLYFADSSGKYLIREERILPKTLSLARETVTQWLKGPLGKDNSIQPLVSPATALLDIAIKDGVATVDLSKEFLKPYQKITPEIEIYGLVNTLTQFSSIKEVCLRIEGKMLNKLGNIDTSHLTNKPSLIKDAAEVNPVLTTPGSTNQGTHGNSTGTASGIASQPTAAKGSALPDSPSTINLFAFPPSST
ncbi:MAG: GerMN domain-containing protein [Desulfitobacteriaceae bacterium]